MSEVEVLIAGGGPAGAATAAALLCTDPSLRGRVLVVDRARFPRAKPCGGGLTGHIDEALAACGLRLTVPSFASPTAEVRYGRLARAVALPRPVQVVRREEFDASLLDQARALGAEVRLGAGLESYAVEQGRVRAVVGGEAIEARVLVGADGAGSGVRKRLSGHRGAGAGPAPMRLFRAELPAGSATGDAMVYDFSPMADGLRGYVWRFPVPGGRVNVGVMHAPEPGGPALSGGALTELARRRIADLDVVVPDRGGDAAGALRGWPAWGYRPGTRVAAPHVLAVGDAAGIDGLTGEGIAVAIEQGAVAARAILAARASGDFAFAGYRRALRRAPIGRELALDRWLARLLYGARHQRWLSFVLCDERILDLYAARVSGTLILSDHKLTLIAALARHLWHQRARRRVLAAAT